MAIPWGNRIKADSTLLVIRLLGSLSGLFLVISAYLASYGYQLLSQTAARLKRSQNLFAALCNICPPGPACVIPMMPVCCFKTAGCASS